MLGVFKNGLVNPPKELYSPAPLMVSSMKPKVPQETLKDFLAIHSNNDNDNDNGNGAPFSLQFSDKALLAYASSHSSFHAQQRLFCGINDMYCIFVGSLQNLCTLNKQYGIQKGGNEAMFIIEAYRTLRDRSPYPAHQVLKDLEGSFGFLIYDDTAGTVFAALGGDEKVKLFWGILEDGSVMISDDVKLLKSSCAKSFAPFPAGCMYHSERGLMSYEHPMNKMKAMPRVDSEGVMCGATFKVDAYSRVHSMPRVGSEANWSTWA